MRPSASGPDSTSSSPVETTPTRGRGVHNTSLMPRLASTPMCAGVNTVPTSNTDVAAREVAARRAHVVAGLAASSITTSSPSACVDFDHDDRVRALRHRRAGHDANRFARADGTRRRAARRPARPRRAAAPARRRCRPRGPRSRPCRCWRTAGPASPAVDGFREHEPERVVASMQPTGRAVSTDARIWACASASEITRARVAARVPAGTPRTPDRGRRGRARARRLPSGSRSSGPRRSDRTCRSRRTRAAPSSTARSRR